MTGHSTPPHRHARASGSPLPRCPVRINARAHARRLKHRGCTRTARTRPGALVSYSTGATAREDAAARELDELTRFSYFPEGGGLGSGRMIGPGGGGGGTALAAIECRERGKVQPGRHTQTLSPRPTHARMPASQTHTHVLGTHGSQGSALP